MKQLTEQEIKFIKETGWTPTVSQCDEWDKTIWTDEHLSLEPHDNYLARREAYSNKYSAIANSEAEKFGVDLDLIYRKCTDESDGISLEYEATYLFYIFFTKEELEKLTDEEATKFLQNFQYYSGYRKWDSGNFIYVHEAIDIYEGKKVIQIDADGSVNVLDRDV